MAEMALLIWDCIINAALRVEKMPVYKAYSRFGSWESDELSIGFRDVFKTGWNLSILRASR